MSGTEAFVSFAAQRQLFAIVTADVGCGKTTAIRKLTDYFTLRVLPVHANDTGSI
ncbi:hypothetical protein [Acetobacterium bakii]|uniref:hypothetical protein n=1 Tax=Acetobacterium bakii TaxID=52689 RepID=UPI001364BFD3|nr:hypothetical protein [Acetobacterium bakii]